MYNIRFVSFNLTPIQVTKNADLTELHSITHTAEVIALQGINYKNHQSLTAQLKDYDIYGIETGKSDDTSSRVHTAIAVKKGFFDTVTEIKTVQIKNLEDYHQTRVKVEKNGEAFIFTSAENKPAIPAKLSQKENEDDTAFDKRKDEANEEYQTLTRSNQNYNGSLIASINTDDNVELKTIDLNEEVFENDLHEENVRHLIGGTFSNHSESDTMGFKAFTEKEYQILETKNSTDKDDPKVNMMMAKQVKLIKSLWLYRLTSYILSFFVEQDEVRVTRLETINLPSASADQFMHKPIISVISVVNTKPNPTLEKIKNRCLLIFAFLMDISIV